MILFRYNNYESEEDKAVINQLENIEKQDKGYKDKIMQQNKQDMEKSKVVKEQKKILENIVYQRMLIQKGLTKANQLPQAEHYPEFAEKHPDAISELKDTLKENLVNLNDICVLLGKRINVNLKPIKENDDVYKIVDSNYDKLNPTCEELVQKWHSRTQVSTNILNKKLNKKNVSLSSLQQPILTQVYKTMENKQFIETRSHQKRDVYRVLGKPAESINEKLDFQIYDDHEFYQSLMKEFLSSSMDTLDTEANAGEEKHSMSLTQEYLRKREQLRKMRGNKKKKSNKISKDRKLKFIIHDKLINFMVPQETEKLSEGREDILKILFGCSTEETQKRQEDMDEGQKVAMQKPTSKEDDEDLGMELI